jgi:predicted transcriptional regulator|tara:strand:+ start:43 stop:249 length:207 start_codon:yes stop_codon:yes gene_type:complete
MAMTLRLTDELDARIDSRAKQAGISKNQLIIQALEEHLDRTENRAALRATVEKVLKRDAELLERLADS